MQTTNHKNTRPLFIGFYDAKLLGIRYLSAALKTQGYHTNLIFMKNFNSYNVDEPTETEYKLLIDKIIDLKPSFIGLSVMCSFYLSVIERVCDDIRKVTDVPIILGGAYGTLFPVESLDFADVVFRGESEEAIIEFADAIEHGTSYEHIQNIAYMSKDGAVVNEIRPLIENITHLAHPDFGGDHMFFINSDKIGQGDPGVNAHSYELTTSRGCPNMCSYCSNSTIRELYKGKGKFIRQREVDDVINELLEAKRLNPGLQILRFWDEIFPWNAAWVKEFTQKYKQHINLPFEVWGHPRVSANLENTQLLVSAGLSKIVIGIQSGDPKIRMEIYTRSESQEDILKCAQILSEAKVPIVIYDFILGHPFETEKDLRNTLDLCRKLAKPFRLQLHGLSFLPGTPIEKIAVERGVKTWDEINAEQARPLREQYHSMAWWRQGHGANSAEKVYWYTLIYLTQFSSGERIIKKALKNDALKKNPAPLLRYHKLYNLYIKFQMGFRKLGFILKSKT